MRDRFYPVIQCALFGVVLWFPTAESAERFTEIQYDEAGRVESIETAVEAAPPVVVAMSPSVVRHGPEVAITVSGSSLRGATVSASDPGITVSAVTSFETRVTLRLQAADSVPLGEHTLRFTTVLGEASIQFTVYPRLPVLAVSPNPLTLEPGETRVLGLRTDRADVIDHTISLSASPSTVATISHGAAQLPAGSTEIDSVSITGGIAGNAILVAESNEMADVVVPVFVTPRYVPPAGGTKFYSDALGVVVGSVSPPREIPYGPFVAILGVVKTTTPPSPSPQPFGPLVGALVGIERGAIALQVQPSFVVRSSGPVLVEVTGRGLDAVQSVSVDPPNDLTVAIQSVAPDGARLVLSVDADAAAELGERVIKLTDASANDVRFEPVEAARLDIVDEPPSSP